MIVFPPERAARAERAERLEGPERPERPEWATQLVAPKQAFATYNDHRMAMSMALFSCAGFDIQIENPACVAKSFPHFWEEWAKI